MRNTLLKLIAVTALELPGYSQAGWVSLPDSGFASSSYTHCYNEGRLIPHGGITNNIKGNFGSYPIAAGHYPSAGTNDTCWVTFSGSEALLPVGLTGFSITAATTRSIPNPIGGSSIGELYDRYWRNPSTNMCVIATRVRMYNIDADVLTGTQYFEINDIVRGGFSGLGSVDIAYSISVSPSTMAAPIYRVGRTFTSVQHRAYKYDTLANKAENGINYLDLPTKNSVTAAISGESLAINSVVTASTTLSTQDAVANDNYIDFTTHAVYVDTNLTAKEFSPITYIQASCSANPTAQANAIRLRQTGQESIQKEILMTGYAIGTP